MSNLPNKDVVDSSEATRRFFDSYGSLTKEFGANEVEAAIGFFQSKGFERQAAETTALILLNQAKEERRSVFKILDTLKGLSELELSSFVARVLNTKRKPISQLGFRFFNDVPRNIARNIRA